MGVRLTKIYTRLGDGGQTHLGDMSRVSKASLRIAAVGDADELNATIGLARLDADDELGAVLAVIQNDLFDLGADLCVPGPDGDATRLRIRDDQVASLERHCDGLNARLQSLKSFILPAGTPLSARLHHARTVCRRAERSAVALAEAEDVSGPAVRYLNRLSDLLFIMARIANRDSGDVLWVPGGDRDSRR
ncbi:MAG: cob(I)yrinic acid a,c-diamide adenosyltransferase [Actinobacteria bacterium]|nr:cob(I)yrinic acid a,c-diamide adenosyltransferase [Actinomycetota bacterium]